MPPGVSSLTGIFLLPLFTTRLSFTRRPSLPRTSSLTRVLISRHLQPSAFPFSWFWQRCAEEYETANFRDSV
ncbi:hypothetical protein E2C01_023044 [Portunus trituberculatus]|uniref:Secreted protein n=1 Tax=Portunus trituberculatus TaxID=210409 RepID=A0A5B7EAI1_PORTR|nr:hypothetical protein [Portunus trituberculatus]